MEETEKRQRETSKPKNGKKYTHLYFSGLYWFASLPRLKIELIEMEILADFDIEREKETACEWELVWVCEYGIEGLDKHTPMPEHVTKNYHWLEHVTQPIFLCLIWMRVEFSTTVILINFSRFSNDFYWWAKTKTTQQNAQTRNDRKQNTCTHIHRDREWVRDMCGRDGQRERGTEK